MEEPTHIVSPWPSNRRMKHPRTGHWGGKSHGPGFVCAFDKMNLIFALANDGSPGYAFCYVHKPTEGRASLLLYLLHPPVFWCGEAETLASTFSPNEW